MRLLRLTVLKVGVGTLREQAECAERGNQTVSLAGSFELKPGAVGTWIMRGSRFEDWLLVAESREEIEQHLARPEGMGCWGCGRVLEAWDSHPDTCNDCRCVLAGEV